MDRYAVVGNPVEHSQSPFIHAQFAAQTQQALHYERLPSPLDAFEPTVRAFAQSGARGCNVTVPFKHQAFALAGQHSARAALAGTANLLRFDADHWYADNTDGVGLVRDITCNAEVALAGRRVLLWGAGGAAAGVLGPLLEEKPAQLVIVNRTASKALALVQSHAAHARAHGVELQSAPVDDCGAGYDVLINATSSSLQGGAIAIAPTALRPSAFALDLMYGAAAGAFLAWAEAYGARGRDGLGMLVEQAAEAFYVWRGVRPDAQPVLEALRRRLAGAHAL